MSTKSSVTVLDSSVIQPVDFSEFKNMPPNERASYDEVDALALPGEKIQEFIDGYINLFPNIVECSFSACRELTDKTINSLLKKAPKLKKLTLQGDNLESFVITAPNSLEEINLASNQLDRVNVINCSELKKLILINNPLDPEHLFLPPHSYIQSGSTYKPNIKIIADNFNEESAEVIGSFVASSGMASYNDELKKKFGDRQPVTGDDDTVEGVEGQEDENFYGEVGGIEDEEETATTPFGGQKPTSGMKQSPKMTPSSQKMSSDDEEDENIYGFDDEEDKF